MKCFANSNLMALCDINKGQFMSCCCLYRGDVLPRNVNIALSQYKKQNKDRFVDWCPNMFKVGITYQPIVTVNVFFFFGS
jgi:tubulin alpha